MKTKASQHPSANRFPLKAVLLMATAATVLGVAGYLYSQQALVVDTVRPEFQTVSDTIEEVGTLASQKTLTVYAQTTGTIEQMTPQVGDTVTTKTLLVRFKGDQNALQLEDANAKIQAAKAALEGTALGTLANKMDLAKLAVAESERQVAVLQQTYEQTKSLNDSGSTSNEDLKAVTNALNSAKNQLKSAQVSYKEIAAGIPNYQRKQLQAQLEQALIYRSSLQLEASKLNLYAPMSGVVLERYVDVQTVTPYGTPLMKIGDMTRLEVLVDVLADDIGQLNLRDPVELRAAYLGDRVLTGYVKKIAPIAKETLSNLGVSQKRLTITVALDQTDELLKPGMPMDVTLILTQKKDVLTVPSVAVFEDASGKGVYVVRDSLATLVRVDTGIESGDVVEILNGLTREDVLILSPLTEVKAGMKVKAN